jgi:heme-degrading monooxygenase HmoA
MFCQTPPPPYHVVIFTSQRTALDDGYTELNDELYQEAQTFDGYIGAETLRNTSGFGVAVLYWRDAESIQRWAQHARHIRAKALGKEIWYEGYRVRIGRVEREYGMG